MQEYWTHEVERIALQTVARGERVIGITSVQRGAGVSLLCHRMCEVLTLSGQNPLYVDLTGQMEAAVPPATFRPGQSAATPCVEKSGNGYHRLTARFDTETRFLYSTPAKMRAAFEELLASYSSIIVNLPPVPTRDTTRINAAAAAAACDGTIVVAMSGDVTKSELGAGIDALATAQARMLGFVLNEARNPTLGAELAREARRLKRFLPRFSAWLEAKASSSVFLN